MNVEPNEQQNVAFKFIRGKLILSLRVRGRGAIGVTNSAGRVFIFFIIFSMPATAMDVSYTVRKPAAGTVRKGGGVERGAEFLCTSARYRGQRIARVSCARTEWPAHATPDTRQTRRRGTVGPGPGAADPYTYRTCRAPAPILKNRSGGAPDSGAPRTLGPSDAWPPHDDRATTRPDPARQCPHRGKRVPARVQSANDNMRRP